ncbi:hypothetical protein AGR2A_Lc180087 [Agrobacterium genomosp. 2 str. CFBP 5494]|uniref:Uncharacterized protein n=1 Tax=Agrobacterium genomosp. 2 str. CFBP 5494 TaxID=1183436 RepID=A0A9W5F146_9HYPH|nr:hypothetical protein AGR2A_Lc180087 [Agrobacterium genomosp. 2 str. CFBP 5494]
MSGPRKGPARLDETGWPFVYGWELSDRQNR